MKTILRVTTVVTVAIGLSNTFTSAFATDTREAIKMCESNKNCTITEAGDRYVMLVAGNGGQKNQVECPKINGACTASLTTKSRKDVGSRKSTSAYD